MNRIPIRNVVSVPIRSRQERTSFARSITTPCGSVPRGGRLTRIAPITRPVIRPESSRSRSAPTTATTTNINVPVTACDWVGLNHAAQARIRTAPATPRPTPTPTLRRNWKTSCPAFACPATTALNTTTPSVAPMGSARVPSHFRTRLTFFDGRMKSSSGPTTVGPGDDEHRAEHERDLEGQVEQQVGGDRPDRPRDQDSEGHQSPGDASHGAGELAQLQAEPGFEQDDPDGDRDNGGDQLLAKQVVGIQRTGRACTEPQGEQHQDRRQPEDLADQGRRRRQDEHEPELGQRLRLGERRHREGVEQAVHHSGVGSVAASRDDHLMVVISTRSTVKRLRPPLWHRSLLSPPRRGSARLLARRRATGRHVTATESGRRRRSGRTRSRCLRIRPRAGSPSWCRSVTGACSSRRSRSTAGPRRSWRWTWPRRRSPGLRVQACGDAHLSNFGIFAAPDRRLVFDVNDFDETLPGPVGVGRQAPGGELRDRRARARLHAKRDARRGAARRCGPTASAMREFAAMRQPRRLVRPPGRRTLLGEMRKVVRARAQPQGGAQGRSTRPRKKTSLQGVRAPRPRRRRRAADRQRPAAAGPERASSSPDDQLDELEGPIGELLGRLPGEPRRRSSAPLRQLPVRRSGPQGGRGRQRRDPLPGWC